MRLTAVLALLALAVLLSSQPAPREQVGPLANGGFLLNSGWRLRPAGKQVPLSTLPMAAALSANHLAALLLPPTLRRLYIACDADAAGVGAATTLTSRAEEAGVEVFPLSPRLGDFNEDLRTLGPDELRAAMRVQLLPEDVARFLRVATDTG
jgi:hypothetical protein